MHRRRHGVRLVYPHSMIEEVMCTLGIGQRLDILRFLADGPKNVSTLAQELFLDLRIVSKDLCSLEMSGFVSCTKERNLRIYELTHRVRVLRRGDCVQLVVQTNSGPWLLLNFDGSGPADTIEPPTAIVADAVDSSLRETQPTMSRGQAIAVE